MLHVEVCQHYHARTHAHALQTSRVHLINATLICNSSSYFPEHLCCLPCRDCAAQHKVPVRLCLCLLTFSSSSCGTNSSNTITTGQAEGSGTCTATAATQRYKYMCVLQQPSKYVHETGETSPLGGRFQRKVMHIS